MNSFLATHSALASKPDLNSSPKEHLIKKIDAINPAKQQLHIHAQIEASYTYLNINSEGKMIRTHSKYHNLAKFLYN